MVFINKTKFTSWNATTMQNKKLIRRWDSECELSLRRHRTRTTKYNRLMHKLRHRSTWLCVATQHRFTKVSEITQCNGHYAVQGHSRFPILVPIESSYTTSYQWLILITSYLAPFPSYGWLLVKFSLARAECFTLTLSLRVIPCQYRHKWYIAKKLDSLAYKFPLQKVLVYLQPLLANVTVTVYVIGRPSVVCLSVVCL